MKKLALILTTVIFVLCVAFTHLLPLPVWASNSRNNDQSFEKINFDDFSAKSSEKEREIISQDQPQCSPYYPDVCIPESSIDLNCKDVDYRNFQVLSPDPYGFDRDHDGIGCEKK